MTDTDTGAAPELTGWRVPQEFTGATSYQVRDVVQDYVRRDLLGPWDGPDESWAGTMTPRDRYLVGLLGPRKVDADERDISEDLDLGATVSHDTDLPEQVNPRTLGKLWVASIGLSFSVADGNDAPRRVVVGVESGRYGRHEELDDDGAPRRVWAREQRMHVVEIDLERERQDFGLGERGTVVDDARGDGVYLRSEVRRLPGRRVVRVTLINDQTPEQTPKDAAWVFQPELTVTALDGAAAVFTPTDIHSTSAEQGGTFEDEDAHLDLLYRHSPAFAHGHNIAVAVERRDGDENAWRLRTTWLPVVDLPQIAVAAVPGLEVGMDALAGLARADDPGPLLTALRPMLAAYTDWLDARETETGALPAEWQQPGRRAVQRARDIAVRIDDALALLGDDAQARTAFAFANTAMALQRHNTVAAQARERDSALSYADALAASRADQMRNASWRPFQLAFVLLNLPAITRPEHPDRLRQVDLLFFPTGGGKTEAYLGLAAYTFAIRRLQGVVGSGETARDGGAGVAVLMRYTLRLLTAQQFQRAAALVCAAEVIRRDDPGTWGTERFSIGLWVGTSVSPNWYHDAERSVAQAREAGRSRRVPVLQTTNCPWCSEPLLGHRDLHPDDGTRRIRLSCPRAEAPDACPFSVTQSPDGLPIMTVDEEVYREPPSLLIATVDKLAQLPWYGFAGSLFGRVGQRCPRHGYRHPDLDGRVQCGSRHTATASLPAVTSQPVMPLRPPDLVIQDELHLISGALGSTVGLFEAAVEELTGWVTPDGTRTTPKIIASTATTKRAGEQVRALFARDLAMFPPPVLDSRDTFFSVEQPHTKLTPGRRYLGICAHGVRLKSAEIRLAEILLLAGQTTLDTYGHAADPYSTIVGYFNATRELAGMRRYLDDDVMSRIRRQSSSRAGLSRRRVDVLAITELTSRVSSGDIAGALRQLAVPFNPETDTSTRRAAIRSAYRENGGKRPDDLPDDPRATDVALATSMLQVGVDVARLGLMVVTGQPKNVAEYIQATSRVGREASKPGLVITLFNWTRPRDLAYYEDFEHTHQTLYRRVEALSVTPYARRCLDRGVAGTFVAAVRNRRVDWSLDVSAQTVDLSSADVVEIGERMAERAETASGPHHRGYLVEKIQAVKDRWSMEQNRAAAPVAYRSTRQKGQQYAGLLHAAGDGRWTELTVARSMRETENDINLLLPASPGIFDPTYGAPDWRFVASDDEADDS